MRHTCDLHLQNEKSREALFILRLHFLIFHFYVFLPNASYINFYKTVKRLSFGKKSDVLQKFYDYISFTFLTYRFFCLKQK